MQQPLFTAEAHSIPQSTARCAAEIPQLKAHKLATLRAARAYMNTHPPRSRDPWILSLAIRDARLTHWRILRLTAHIAAHL